MSWKRPIFALATVLLFFGIVEGALWLAGVETLLSRQDPFQGFSDQLRVYELDEPRGLYRTPARAVTHSFNYQQFAADKPDDGFRIFIIGGSSAQGFPWGGASAFTRLLGEALQASWPDRTIEAINAAAMSYGSHRLRILAPELVEYRPDVLVVYGGHNEFVERRFYSDFIERSGQLDFFRGLLYRSRLYSAMAGLYERSVSDETPQEADSWTAGELLGLDVRREYSEDVAEAERRDVREHFRDNLRAIVGIARAAGTRVVLCTVPSNLRDWPPNQSLFDPSLDFEQRQAVLGLLAEARSARERGDATTALTSLERATEISPGYAEIYFLRGKALEDLGRWEEARRAYVRARDLDAQPGRASSELNETIRRVAAEEGTLLVDFEKSFEESSSNGLVGFELLEDYVHPKPEGHRLIARELWSVFQQEGLLGEVRSADAAEFERALDESRFGAAGAANESNPSWLFNLAVVLEKQGLVEQAIEKYRACVRIDPGYYVAYFNLGRLLFGQGRYAEAAAMHRRALEVQPDYVRAMVGLGEALRRIDRAADAERVLKRAIELDPGSAATWGSLGGVLSQLGNQVEAEAAFQRAVELDPRDAGARADLGYTLLYQGKLDEAEALFRAALDLRPEELRARNGLAAVLTESGELDEAERIFRENLVANPEDAFARGGLAEVDKRRKGG